MRGRLPDGKWITPFDPLFPYYEYMYREANAWQSSFFAPQDVKGLIGLYPSRGAFEKKLDDLFSIPWNGVEAYNLSVFIGQYCHGNQPDHGYPFMYYFVGKQQKTQALLNHILDHFYDMGKERLAYAGMDDAGEMSSWYVFNAMGLYPFSPADAAYLVTVPLFDKVQLKVGEAPCTIVRMGSGNRIGEITCKGRKLDGYFIPHADVADGETLTINTR
jgi:putative alpha-1,2-mannosidase